jgi:hypothetical protein
MADLKQQVGEEVNIKVREALKAMSPERAERRREEPKMGQREERKSGQKSNMLGKYAEASIKVNEKMEQRRQE